ncbi:ChaB family protein [Mycobacterium sp. 21AC1]|uniref:ChaB family protein n=1 Tax=[Mycobacterium] appelbergii TaxID=2939269 RepID=UPI0029393D96|nr:ChaB family protein [Mycobacterium sp. 21AC1]MDV3126914.1 ChaB family protein [Mycobacterium sp. 21AC1]
MPKTTSKGKPKKDELPSTLRKSDTKAQRTFAEAHDSAVETYGEGERAHRVAYSALKHSYEKVGDHWEAKAQRGPSDQRARSGGPDAKGDTAEGVDESASKKHLMDVARRLDVHGRSTMNKDELVAAIEKANRRETRSNKR